MTQALQRYGITDLLTLRVVMYEQYKRKLYMRYTQEMLWALCKMVGRDGFNMPTPSQFYDMMDDRKQTTETRTDDQILSGLFREG